MFKHIVLFFFIDVLFLLSAITWPYQTLYQQSWYGISFLQIYAIVSLVVVAGLLLSLVKHHKRIMLYFLCVFFSWFLVWSSWKDALPPKTYFSLNDDSTRYRIEKDKYYYGLCHTPKKGERLCGFVGSSVYPLDRFVNKEIILTAQWRSDWGRPMCHTEPCPYASEGRGTVIDILDIRLATNSSLQE